MRLVLARHGETSWSRDHRHTSTTDVELTAVGRAQAVALGRRLVGPFSRILVSPLRRAGDTCRLAGFGDRAEVLGDLTEWRYGAYEGRTTEAIHDTRPGWSLWSDGAPDGESPAEVGARADRVLARLEGASGDVVLFSHGHLLRVVTARWLGLPAAGGRLFRLSTGTLSLLGWERDTRVILLWNAEVGQV
ncbi:MAG: histidine phosphatase family protein [Euzebyales bacterium]|nr:histidine phosphatase family protein [Euzebyales bacterium]